VLLVVVVVVVVVVAFRFGTPRALDHDDLHEYL